MEMLNETLDWRPALLERSSAVPEVFRVGPMVVHRRTGNVETPTGKQRLRAKELELLMHLYEHVTITFSREDLLQRVWNYAPDLLTRTVDQTVATLRKKIELDPERPRCLQTVYGIGYRLVL
ncbi:MAG TPA: helix-turn-helix domain-containing protein [Methylomirabilota bacterium]|nr:helix-turn-helix domain-containing protein [Methylomirabilota bacterium]